MSDLDPQALLDWMRLDYIASEQEVMDLATALIEAREALSATQRAKAENDERFLTERDEARTKADDLLDLLRTAQAVGDWCAAERDAARADATRYRQALEAIARRTDQFGEAMDYDTHVIARAALSTEEKQDV